MEEIIGIAIIAAAIGLLVNGWEIYKKNNNQELGNMRTRDLLIDVLTRIGSQCHLEEENEDVILFDYLDEHFFAVVSKEMPCVQIYDLRWMSVNVCNIDEVSEFKKSINNSNMDTAVNTYYEIDKDKMTIFASSRILIMLLPSIPRIEDYLKAILVEFFRGHKIVWEGVYNMEEVHNA